LNNYKTYALVSTHLLKLIRFMDWRIIHNENRPREGKRVHARKDRTNEIVERSCCICSLLNIDMEYAFNAEGREYRVPEKGTLGLKHGFGVCYILGASHKEVPTTCSVTRWCPAMGTWRGVTIAASFINENKLFCSIMSTCILPKCGT
jgi:hypothetical protein